MKKVIILTVFMLAGFLMNAQERKHGIAFNAGPMSILSHELSNTNEKFTTSKKPHIGFDYNCMLSNKFEMNLGIRVIGASVNFNFHPFNTDEKKWSPYIGVHASVGGGILSGSSIVAAPVGAQYKSQNGWFVALEASPLRGIQDGWAQTRVTGIALGANLRIGYRFKRKSKNKSIKG